MPTQSFATIAYPFWPLLFELSMKKYAALGLAYSKEDDLREKKIVSYYASGGFY